MLDIVKQNFRFAIGLTFLGAMFVYPVIALLFLVSWLWKGLGGTALLFICITIGLIARHRLSKHFAEELKNTLDADLYTKDIVLNGRRYLGANAAIISRHITKTGHGKAEAKYTCKTPKGTVFYYQAQIEGNQIYSSNLVAIEPHMTARLMDGPELA